MLLIDTHAHLNFAEFNADREQVMKNSLGEGIFMINVGVNYESSKIAVAIAEKYETGVWAAIGLHPENIEDSNKESKKENILPEHIRENDFNFRLYEEMAQSGKVVAVGEIGLDYLRLPKDKVAAQNLKEKQIEICKRQIAFAREMDLPVIFHCRMAHQDMIEILKEEAKNNGAIKGAVHCFTGGVAELASYLALGLRIGLNGIIYKMDLGDVIKKIPQERILLETDCPYLTPPRLAPRNNPQNVEIIAQRVAQIRNEPAESLIAIANRNAQTLFGI